MSSFANIQYPGTNVVMARVKTYPLTKDEIGLEKYWNTIENMPAETVTNMIVITPVVNVI